MILMKQTVFITSQLISKMTDRANDGAAIPDLHENNEIMCISKHPEKQMAIFPSIHLNFQRSSFLIWRMVS